MPDHQQQMSGQLTEIFHDLIQAMEDSPLNPKSADRAENAMVVWMMLEVLHAMQTGKVPRDRCLQEEGVRLTYHFNPLNTRQPKAWIKIVDGDPLKAWPHKPDFSILSQYGKRQHQPFFTCWRLNSRLIRIQIEGGECIFFDPEGLLGDDHSSIQLERISMGSTFGQSNLTFLAEQETPTLNSFPSFKLRMKTESGHKFEVSVALRIPIIEAEVDSQGRKFFTQDVYGGLVFTEGDPHLLSDSEWSGVLATSQRLLCEEVFVTAITGGQSAEYIKVPGNYGFTPNWVASQPSTSENLGLLKEWRDTQTPLDRAVGYAVFALTNPKDPGAMQRFSMKSLRDRVWPDGKHPTHWKEDICESLGRYQTQTLHLARKDIERHGRFYVSTVTCYNLIPIPTLGFVYVDTASGEEFNSTKGAGKRISEKVTIGRNTRKVSVKMIEQPEKTLIAVELRLNQDLVEWMLMEPARDDKGKALRDRSGKVIRKGSFFLLAQERFFDLNAAARVAKMDIAWDLFERLIYDRRRLHGSFEVAAPILFRRMGWDWEDSNRRGRHCEQLKRAIQWLKTEDVLTPPSTDHPQESTNLERRKDPYFRFRFTPGWVKKIEDAEAEVRDAEIVEQEEEDLRTEKEPTAPRRKKPSQQEFDLGVDVGISSAALPGAIVKKIRDAAPMTVRQWAAEYGSSKSAWSKWERGLSQKPPKIVPESWVKIRVLAEKQGIRIDE